MATRRQEEKVFQNQLIGMARNSGYLVYHTYDSRRSVPGFPDLVIVGYGQCIFSELKSSTGRISKAQQEWLDEIGAVETPPQAYLWRPKDTEQIVDVIRAPILKKSADVWDRIARGGL